MKFMICNINCQHSQHTQLEIQAILFNDFMLKTICSFIYTHIYSYKLIYTHIHSYTHMYTHIHYSYTLKYTHIQSYTLIYNHIHSCTHMYTHIHSYTLLIYTHTHSYTLIHTHRDIADKYMYIHVYKAIHKAKAWHYFHIVYYAYTT